MNLKDKQQQLQKARDFIRGGVKEAQKPESVPITAPQEKPEKHDEEPKEKRYATYYLDADLIMLIKIEAAKNNEQPSHLVGRIMERELSSKQ